MSIFCPRCERRHELTAGEAADGFFYCECGAAFRPGARARLGLLRRRADEVCRMILSSACPAVEIALERGRLRSLALDLFPDRIDLYDMIYESRFDRLLEQFRGAGGDGD